MTYTEVRRIVALIDNEYWLIWALCNKTAIRELDRYGFIWKGKFKVFGKIEKIEGG